ncbi:MAG: ribosome small subunit-dependent GTPase A [Lachnospiraceae bacterium]|nr:ribosome small subunit-dependent GTPase A [Lachnospiraceae bacterium]MBR1523469.1 ribosome small subunit-dependent GTPase A [Lachnospiraceae bacterium]
MLEGRILKGIGGFYYVYTDEGVYQCRAKGLFRKKSFKPLAGDRCRIELTHTDDVEGNVVEILPRSNALIRPPVANIDQALIIFAMHSPEPVWGLLDRYLITMERAGIGAVICINKDDLAEAAEQAEVSRIYGKTGYRLIFSSVVESDGLDELREALDGKVTSVAGPSGAGKSSVINALVRKDLMETGEISRKLGRGKQTTRHTELVYLWEDTFIFDSPGFSAMELPDMEAANLTDCYPEMRQFKGQCFYADCTHTHEPDCRIKEALDAGEISRERYDSYADIYKELTERRNY